MYLCISGPKFAGGISRLLCSTFQKDLILTLVITVMVEGAVALGYSIWRKKPIRPILFTSIIANLITQSLLWIVLNLFFRHYLLTLLIAEIFIWIVESASLSYISANRLPLADAMFLSLNINLASFAIGWFLPV